MVLPNFFISSPHKGGPVESITAHMERLLLSPLPEGSAGRSLRARIHRALPDLITEAYAK